MSTPKKDYSSLKYIIEQPSKKKQSSFSLPRDYSNHDNLFIKNLNQRKNMSTCEIIQTVSNENDLEEIYLDDYEIDELKNGIENNEADLSDETSGTSVSCVSIPSSISLLERLIRTHPIWLLTNLERSEVTKLLQNKEAGTFIVRNSSKPGTMALSVRLPKGKGPYIEHYLVENLGNRKLHLEGSAKYFSVIPMLICHYCQCMDELPVMLKLPEIILNASRNQLNSLSLLCDKFWTTNFDDQDILSTSNDEDLDNRSEHLNGHDVEQNNNLVQKTNSLNSKRSSQTRSSLEGRNSIEAKELMVTSEDEDHNFIKKEVFNSGSECDLENKLENENKKNGETVPNENDIEENEETEVKKLFLEDEQSDNEQDKVEEKVNTKVDELLKSEDKNEEIVKEDLKEDVKKDLKESAEENNNLSKENLSIPVRPPRRNIGDQINASPPPLPSRGLKPAKDYFKLNASLNESTNDNDKSKPEESISKKKSIASNLNLLIDFDVLEQEEKLIQQLRDENCIYNLNQINAQTQQLMSSQISTQLNSESSVELISSEPNQKTQQSIVTDQDNVTKIEVNGNFAASSQLTSKMQEDLDELNLIEMKLNESKNGLEINEPLIKQSSIIQPLIAQPTEAKQKDLPIIAEDTSKKLNFKPEPQKRKKVNKPNTRDCEVQTNAQTILNDLKLESYRNFLIYDTAPNLRLTKNNAELSIFTDPIYSTNEDFFYPHLSKRSHNQSNPSLNHLHNQINRNNEHHHSFESLYVTYDSVYSKQTYFFERMIVPRDPNLSDVCLQVGDGLIKQEEQPKRLELINEERLIKEEAKDAAWQVDNSWQWESSSDEEELTTSIVNNNENISTKYRRYSCKYIIESGVESEADDVQNENCGPQSIANESVKVEELKVKKLNEKLRNGKKLEKTSSPLIPIDSEEACSSGFWESNRQNEQRQTSNIKNKSLRIKQSNQPHKDDETEDEMVFQEIGLDDVYTTNDELDDNNQSMERLEDIYTVAARNLTYSTVAKSISEYIYELHRLNDNVFAKSVRNFIQCTKELYEPNPLVIMRNIRQFINGLKNYLIKNGEKEFLDFVKHERKRLKPEEFLNLEAIITACLHKLIIKPLKEFIYQKFVSMEFQYGYQSFMKLNENLSFLSSRLPNEFGIESNVRLPNKKNMNRIAKFFHKLQNTYSPLKKLEYILSIVSIINYNTKIVDKQTVDNKMVINKQRIDERTFISVFIYLVVKFNVVHIEVELDYIWSLLQPNLINGDANYYLNVLSSCVYVLKINFQICQERNNSLSSIELQRSMITSYLPSINESINAKCKLSFFQKESLSTNLVLPKIINHPDLNIKNFKSSKKRNHTFNQNINELTLMNSNFVNTNVQSYSCELNSFRQDSSLFATHIMQNNNLSIKLLSLFSVCCLKILFLDEFSGNIQPKLVICKPEMMAKEFNKLLAQRFSIFNSEDYSLFLITEKGKEFLVDDNENVFSIKVNAIKYKINLNFVYKRSDSQYVFSLKFYELNQSEFGLI